MNKKIHYIEALIKDMLLEYGQLKGSSSAPISVYQDSVKKYFSNPRVIERIASEIMKYHAFDEGDREKERQLWQSIGMGVVIAVSEDAKKARLSGQ